MKRRFFIKVLVLFGLFLGLLYQSCQKLESETPIECYDQANPDCANYDPCYGVLPTTADFDILEQYASHKAFPGDSFSYSDSFTIVKDISSFGVIKFVAKEKDALHYTWYLGAEIVEDVDVLTRSFTTPDLTPGTEITVTLVVEKYKNLDCIPDNQPFDNITKTFTLVEPCDYWINGTFRGAWLDEQSTDSFDIQFEINGYYGAECSRVFAWNLNNRIQYGECDSVWIDPYYINSSFIDFRSFQNCGLLHDDGTRSSLGRAIFVYNPENNSFRMDNAYFYYRPNSSKKIVYNKTLTGRKLN